MRLTKGTTWFLESLTLRRLRQETCHECKTIMGYRQRSCLQNKTDPTPRAPKRQKQR